MCCIITKKENRSCVGGNQGLEVVVWENFVFRRVHLLYTAFEMNISFIESSKFGSTLYDSFIIHHEEVFNVSSKVSQIVFALILIVLSLVVMVRSFSVAMAGQAGRFIGAFTNEKSISTEAEQMAVSGGVGVLVGILCLIGTGLISLKPKVGFFLLLVASIVGLLIEISTPFKDLIVLSIIILVVAIISRKVYRKG